MTAPRPYAERALFVTGAASGIGHRVVDEALATGFGRVFATDLPAALEVAPAWTDPTRITTLACDVTVESDVIDVVSHCQKGGLTTSFVTCAGILHVDPPGEPPSSEAFQRVLAVNVTGTFNVLKHMESLMADGGTSSAGVCIASMASRLGSPSMCAYNTSKAAVLGLARSFVSRYAPFGARLNCVLPGIVRTPMADTLTRGALQREIDLIPLRRVAATEDIARTIGFLLGDGAAHITGAEIPLDGGVSAVYPGRIPATATAP